MDARTTLDAVPLDAAAAAKAAFAAVEGMPFPDDIFTAPELRWAVVGCGVIANQMARSLALAGRKVYGVANRTLEKAEAFACEYGVQRVYRTVEELYADPAVDAIYITTPHNTHIEYLRGALSAGKHVLCEKAITLNSDELAEARALADEHHVVLMDATTVLHMPLYVELMRRARAGEFGRLRLAQVNFGSYHDYKDVQSRFWNRSLAGGAMLDIGVYALSVARLFMESQPKEVVSLANLFETGVDEESGFITRNAQGMLDIGVYALSVARLFMESQPKEVVSLANLFETGVDEESGFITRNAQGQLGVFSLTMHAKQPKRADLCFDDCYIEVMSYPRADRATITWTSDGHREEVRAGVEAYALCYEIADLEKAVAGDTSKLALIEYASDVMEIMTRLRRDWGVVYPEEE